MLVSPQAAQLSVHFLLRKISSVASPWGTWLRTHYWRIEKEGKKQHLVGIELTTSRVLLHRHVLNHCATTAAQANSSFWLSLLLFPALTRSTCCTRRSRTTTSRCPTPSRSSWRWTTLSARSLRNRSTWLVSISISVTLGSLLWNESP